MLCLYICESLVSKSHHDPHQHIPTMMNILWLSTCFSSNLKERKILLKNQNTYTCASSKYGVKIECSGKHAISNEQYMMTDILKFAYLRIARQVGNPEVANPEGIRSSGSLKFFLQIADHCSECSEWSKMQKMLNWMHPKS